MAQMLTIGVVTQKLYPMPRKMQQGIADYAAPHINWHLEFINAGSHAAHNTKRHNFAGIITTSPRRDVIQHTSRWNIPQVCISGSMADVPANYPFPVIYTDNTAIAREAAEHLRQQGYQNLAFYRMPSKLSRRATWADERQAGFLQYAKSINPQNKTPAIMPDTTCSLENVLKITINWLRQLTLPVGIMAANDEHARTLLEACRMLKLDVPRQVAVIGVDNDEFLCQITTPHLSSVIQNVERSGYEAAELLHRQMQGKKIKKLMKMPPAGIAVRQSTDHLAVTDPVLKKAITFIRQEAHTWNIGVAKVAEIAGVSRTTLDNLARRLTRRTIHDIIAGERLRHARELLEQTRLPLKQVAEHSGFSSVQYMHTVFKKQTNRTPGDYRRTSHHRKGAPCGAA